MRIAFTSTQKYIIFFLVIILSAIVLFTGLNASLRDWDESVYAQVAKESLDHSDWYNLYWNEKPFIDKPPLIFWLTRQVYKMSGVGEWQARIASAVLGLMSVALVMLFGWHFISMGTGVLAALIMLGTPHFVKISKMGQLDVPVGFFIAVSLVSFYIGKKNPLCFLLSGFFTGLAILTKWSVGFLSPIAQVMLVLLPGYRLIIKNKLWWLSFLVTLLVCAPWIIQQYLQYGDIFAAHFLGSKILESVNSEIAGHGGSVFYYVTKILRESRPWCFIFPISIAFGIVQSLKNNRMADFLLVWFFVVFIVFSLAKTKLHWYIQPVYPPLALLTAMGIMHFVKKYKKLQIAVFALALIIIPAHTVFTRNYIKLDLNPEMKTLVESIKADLVKYDRLYVFRITCTPSLLFYTGKPVTLLHNQDDLKQVLDVSDTVFIVTDSSNSSIMREYLAVIGVPWIYNIDQIEQFFVFSIHKQGG